MSVPILLTVGALGAAWVAIGKARAEMPGATAAPAADTAADAVVATAAPVGATEIAQAAESGGAVSIGFNNAAGALGAPLETILETEIGFDTDPKASLGGSGGTDSLTSTPTTAGVAPAEALVEPASEGDTLVTAIYGATDQLSTRQYSAAIAQYGATAGMVW